MDSHISVDEQAARALFKAQMPVPEPFSYDQALWFVREVGAEQTTRHLQNVLGLLSWGHTLEEIVPRIRVL